MIRNLFFILFTIFVFACSVENDSNSLKVNGYEKFEWKMNIEEVKTLINKEYSGNLFEYFATSEQQLINYHFHSGKFLDNEVRLWNVELNAGNLKSIKIYFAPVKNNKEFYKKLSSSLLNIKIDKNKFKNKVSKSFYVDGINKPVTKLILELSKTNEINSVILTIKNLNN